MKRIKSIKVFAFLLAVLLVLTNLFILSPLAFESTGTNWSLSNDDKNITNETDGITYTCFWSGVTLRPDSKYVYVYDQYIRYMDGYYVPVFTNPENPSCVWIDVEGQYHIFVTEDAKADLLAFTEGKTGNYFIAKNDGTRAKISKSVIAQLEESYKNSIDTESFDVRSLKYNKQFDVIVQDESATLAYIRGAVYSHNNDLWYVDYTALDAGYFDANGNFSYYHDRSVNMTKVDNDSLTELLKSKHNLQSYEIIYSYEEISEENDNIVDDWFGNMYDTSVNLFVVFFWIVYFALIVLPAVVLLAVGCILPFSRKFGKPKYWFVVAGLAALWLILALGHWIMLAFPVG